MNNITIAMAECAGLDRLLSPIDAMVGQPVNDMEARCLAAFDAGDRGTLRDRIEELRASLYPSMEPEPKPEPDPHAAHPNVAPRPDNWHDDYLEGMQ